MLLWITEIIEEALFTFVVLSLNEFGCLVAILPLRDTLGVFGNIRFEPFLQKMLQITERTKADFF
uniref:Uncharacterized protein n=1 Tax=Megaselia scalaris TaxID=36166 RepID=T1GDD2_MEGSC